MSTPTKYDPSKLEPKWQKYWLEHGTFTAKNGSAKPKKYVLVEFPYPSGAGLHMGHVRPFTAGDLLSRYYRHRGFEVMYPFGWDAFGLPAENYAIKMGVQPEVSTAQNIANAKRQVLSWGVSFDWSREVNTTDPAYYRWTQWLFLKFYESGLAYQATAMLNWCPKDKTVLANEEVIDGCCERCGTKVEQREMRQWFLKITAYAQKLLDGLETLDWPTAVKVQQVNWIGKKTGINITYKIEGRDQEVTCFTTRPDTNFGATFIVVGPEHPLIKNQQELKLSDEVWAQVVAYKEKVSGEAEQDRTAENRKKTGVFTGSYCINTLNGARMPLYVADYVLGNVGTGAVIGVPGHDKRDFEFAQVFGLSVVRVVQKNAGDTAPITSLDQVQEDEGTMVNSGFLDGMDIHAATEKIMDYMVEQGYGTRVVNFKLRDWVFSRQRYWGEPIPIIHCEKCGTVPVPLDQLPVVLPKVDKYEPTGTGESPLAAIPEWVNVACPKCGGQAKRETDTMPQWAGSSWYFLRYCDPHNDAAFASSEALKYWMPIDLYFGGMEHTTLHLLYSRFWNLFLHDQGLVPVAEPYAVRKPHGIILGPDGEKMSKSRGNVVNPDDIVAQHGADTMRMYELFLGPHDQTIGWSDRGIVGVRRFLDRAWKLVTTNVDTPVNDEDVDVSINKLIKKITEDIEASKFNTAVAAFMEFMNEVEGKRVHLGTLQAFLVMLSPFAPHIAADLWEQSGRTSDIAFAPWPSFDESKLTKSTLRIAIQVNGKLRGAVEVNINHATQAEVEAIARALPTVAAAVANGEVTKVIFVPNRLINFVLKPMV